MALKSYLLALCISVCGQLFAQYDTAHFIPLNRWSYFNDEHEIVFSTLSETPVQIQVYQSDGILISNQTVVKGTPNRFALSGPLVTDQRNQTNTVYSDEGIIVRSDLPVGVNVRNTNGDTDDNILKGNTSITSKGRLALGQEFRLIFYRDAIDAYYGIMATENNTTITQNGNFLVTLQQGENYLIGGGLGASIGDLIQSDKPIVMTSSFDTEVAENCVEPTADQLIPNNMAGEEYICVRGYGTSGSVVEQITYVATENNTTVSINGVPSPVLALAGDYVTVASQFAPLQVSHIVADKPILVAQGAGQGCEHGMSIIPPLRCTGSKHIETKDFHELDYSVFLLSKCGVSPVLNGDTLTGGVDVVGTDWTVFAFDDQSVTGDNIILDSETPMHVGILQDGGAYGGFAYFSGFSKSGVEVSASTASGDSILIEGCIPALYTFTRESFCGQVDTVLITVSGTATEGTDYNELPDTLFFTPGIDTLFLDVQSISDGIAEGVENLSISIIADRNCDNIPDTVSSTLYIEDYVPMTMTLTPDEIDMCVDYFCTNTSEVRTSTASVTGGVPPYSATWSDGFNELIITAPFESTNTFSGPAGNVPFIDTSYLVSIVDACGNEVSDSIFIDNNCPVCAPNIITPNGDLINDVFVIRNIWQYPEARLTIYNRWGNVLFETENYQNDWSGDELVDGVYFYQVSLIGEFDIHGFFHISR